MQDMEPITGQSVGAKDSGTAYLARKGVVLRVLLDTNVIQHLSSFGEYIYDGYLSPAYEKRLANLDEKLRSDVECLQIILGKAPTRTPVTPIVSALSVSELLHTGSEVKAARLVGWGLELMEFASPSRAISVHRPSQRRLSLASNLPGAIDQLLLGECRRLECEALITTDYKSILNRRTHQKIDGALVLSPTEWWALLCPWWPLWV
ncbi:MAG: hypothetical protein WB809_04060 [Thermoplasmata archaeon]